MTLQQKRSPKEHALKLVRQLTQGMPLLTDKYYAKRYRQLVRILGAYGAAKALAITGMPLKYTPYIGTSNASNVSPGSMSTHPTGMTEAAALRERARHLELSVEATLKELAERKKA